MLRYQGSQVSLCLHRTPFYTTSTFYKGEVRGYPNLPFARQGEGWMHFARQRHGPRPRPPSILQGHWYEDQLSSRQGKLHASLAGRPDESKVLLHEALECQLCLTVYSSVNAGNGEKHVCPSDRKQHRAAKRLCPSASLEVVGGKEHSRNEGASTNDSSKNEGSEHAKPSNPGCQLVGFQDGVASAFVMQRLSFADGSRLGGGAGARAFAAYDTLGRGRSVCFAATCRSSITCSLRDTCPHIEAVRDVFNSEGTNVPPGLSLDGYLGLCSATPADLPPRRCTAPQCQETQQRTTTNQRQKREPTEGVSAPLEEHGAASHSAVGGSHASDADCPVESSADVDEEGESDGELSDASTADTEPNDMTGSIAYGYVPSVAEILSPTMRTTRLRAICDELSLDATTCRANLQYNLVEFYHPEDVATLPSRLQELHAATQGVAQARRPHRTKRPLPKMGVVNRAPDKDTAAKEQAFKYERRALRCLNGSMCREHARQKSYGIRLHDRIRALDDVHDELADTDAEEDESAVPDAEEDESAATKAGEDESADMDAEEVSACAECETLPPSTHVGSTGQARNEASNAQCARNGARGEAVGQEGKAVQGDAQPLNPSASETCSGGSAAVMTSRTRRAAAVRAQAAPSFQGERLSSKELESRQEKLRQGDEIRPSPMAWASKSNRPRAKGASPAKDDCPCCEPSDASKNVGEEFRYTKLHLTPTQADDFLYSITLARNRGAAPVVPIAHDHYAVLRTEADECSYSCPGGYSLVKAALRQDPIRPGGTILSFHCTCSEYRSCRAGMGGKSKKGSKRFCTCCLMVVAANVLDAPLERIKQGDSAWLIAGRQHANVRAPLRHAIMRSLATACLPALPPQWRASPPSLPPL